MHRRLVSYLRDNRDQIIENWLTEAEIPTAQPGAEGSSAAGVIPLAFFADAFEAVVSLVENGPQVEPPSKRMQLKEFIGLTCACRQRQFGGRVCIELHDSGLKAFLSVFSEEWDTEQEFNELDRDCCAHVINRALAALIAAEIDHCTDREERPDCPFAGTRLLHSDRP